MCRLVKKLLNVVSQIFTAVRKQRPFQKEHLGSSRCDSLRHSGC